MLKRYRPITRRLPSLRGRAAWFLLAIATAGTTAGMAILGQELLSELKAQGTEAFDLAQSGQHAMVWSLLPIAASWTAILSAITALLTKPGLAHRAGATKSPPIQEWSDVMADVRQTLAEHKAELCSLQNSNATAVQDSILAGARLTTFALEAQDRLNAGVNRAVSLLSQPLPAMERALEMVQRLEVIMPYAMDAARQTTSLQQVSSSLQAETGQLTQISRELATVGAHVIAQISEIAAQIDTTGLSAPEDMAATIAAVREVSEAMATTSELLRLDTVRLDASGEGLRREAGHLMRDVSVLHQISQKILEQAVRVESSVEAGVLAWPDLQHTLDGPVQCLTVELARIENMIEFVSNEINIYNESSTDIENSTTLLRDSIDKLAERTASQSETEYEHAKILADSIEAISTSSSKIESILCDSLDHLARSVTNLEHHDASLGRTVEHLNTGISNLHEFGPTLLLQVEAQTQLTDQMVAVASESVANLRVQADMLLEAIQRAMTEQMTATSIGLTQNFSDYDKVESPSWQFQQNLEALDSVFHKIDAVCNDLVPTAGRLLEASSNIQVAFHHAATAAPPPQDAKLEASILSRFDELFARISDIERRLEAPFQTPVTLETLSNITELLQSLKIVVPENVQLPSISKYMEKAISELVSMVSANTSNMDLTTIKDTLASFSTEMSASLSAIEAGISALSVAGATLTDSSETVDKHLRNIVIEQTVTDHGQKSCRPFGALDIIQREIAGWIAESETLAEFALAGRGSEVLERLPDCVPDMLRIVEGMTQGLRSVGTAIALASDHVQHADRSVA